ncbi:glucuronosyltransferase pgsip8-like protein [Trifolium pratense]|uniref:Glucuronosyltransferase pgsip8-like protein n=1 Tax=Trifolium pratense TaxID=57577 RepID=A0A2K3MJ55_TRIPR|nr:glucuronosyltransferase pgsip8-like protein [Trifolium pratense]
MGYNAKSLIKWFLIFSLTPYYIEATSLSTERYKNAYATMMYVGTPRDYEFYVAVRVLIKSLSKLNVQADLVVIASLDVPLPWIQAL